MWGYGIVVWALTTTFVAPLLVAWQRWDPLDTLPYLLCLGAGLACSVAVYHLWQLPMFRERRSSLGVLFVVWAPFLAVGIGLGSNVVFDRSAPVRHDTIFLGYVSEQKGPIRESFASWRKPGAKEKLKCTTFARASCVDAKPGQRVTVTTHHGALGWEWIADLAIRASQ